MHTNKKNRIASDHNFLSCFAKIIFQVENSGLLYSIDLKVSILQIELLNYLPGQSCICVLTPRRLIGLSVAREESSNKLIRSLFDHKLDSTFYSLASGGYNGESVKSDFIFILGLNGSIKGKDNIFKINEGPVIPESDQ